MREELGTLRSCSAQEIENLKRALNDIKYQNEENMRTINLKEDENRFLQKDLQGWKEVLEKTSMENQRLNEIIEELEQKNRMMNEKLNEVIYNKASAYK